MTDQMLLFGLSVGLFLVLLSWVSWKMGHTTGFHQWRADATRAVQLGVMQGRREERVAQRRDPLLDEGEEWKRGDR
jgi:hypothetical protein